MSDGQPPVRPGAGAAAAPPSDSVSPRLLWTVAIGIMLVPLNSTMIAVALPTLIDDLDASVSSVSWLVTSYLVAMAVLQPVGGHLGDRIGRRRLMLGGLTAFGLASAAAAAA
jgi:MFS family permease